MSCTRSHLLYLDCGGGVFSKWVKADACPNVYGTTYRILAVEAH